MIIVFLCTFATIVMQCCIYSCVNYLVCLVDPDKLMMSNVYTVFFICDVYLSKVSSNETQPELSVCFTHILSHRIINITHI